MKGIAMTKKDIAVIAGPIVGLVAFAAVNVAAVKFVEYRKNRAAKKAETQTEQNETTK
jgi:predicted dinucleotide-utilizing enzyme